MLCLQLDQSMQWLKGLNAPLNQSLGQYVYLLQQQHTVYVAKFLAVDATIQTQYAFLQELHFYQHLQGYPFCPEFQLCRASHLLDVPVECSPEQHVILFPYYTSLDQRIAQTLDLQQLLTLFLEICLQVKNLHDCGFCHGDLKRQHLVYAVLTTQPQLKLLDYAQLLPIDRTEQRTAFTLTATPAYMAPELFLGESPSVQSDLYALGIIFFEMLMKKKPFTAKTYHDWAIQHCQAMIPLLPKQYVQCQTILDGMLAKHKHHRFLYMTQLIDAVNSIKLTKYDD